MYKSSGSRNAVATSPDVDVVAGEITTKNGGPWFPQRVEAERGRQ